MEELKDILREGNYSCVIRKGTEIRKYSQRGIKDLWTLFHEEPSFLQGSSVADKVVGKGAAALIALSGVSKLFAGVISQPAVELLSSYPIELSFNQKVPNIINRAQSGGCPLESLCREALTAEECIPLIKGFLASLG